MKYIFITGMGRSGTTFLARMLEQISNTNTRHEGCGNREYWLLSWYLDEEAYAIPYLEREKQKIEQSFENEYFIDVNGYLQNSVSALRIVFQPDGLFHLVRDGRAVVRSLYARRSEKNIHLIPQSRLEVEEWLDGDKFTQICWNWASTTQQLISQNTSLIQFEKLLQDYDYFSENLLSPFGLVLSYEAWAKRIGQKTNQTRSKLYRWVYSKLKGKEYIRDELPAYEFWDETKKKQFNKICGEAMEMAGYKL